MATVPPSVSQELPQAIAEALATGYSTEVLFTELSRTVQVELTKLGFTEIVWSVPTETAGLAHVSGAVLDPVSGHAIRIFLTAGLRGICTSSSEWTFRLCARTYEANLEIAALCGMTLKRSLDPTGLEPAKIVQTQFLGLGTTLERSEGTFAGFVQQFPLLLTLALST